MVEIFNLGVSKERSFVDDTNVNFIRRSPESNRNSV